MPAPLEDPFNKCTFEKMNDVVLRVNQNFDDSAYVELYYDFALRIMFTSWSGTHVAAFSQLDRGVLTEMRDQLVKLGGKPPELPAAPAAYAPPAPPPVPKKPTP